MEILPAAKLPVTPAGNPLNVALVAPVDVKVMFVREVFMQLVGEFVGDVRVIVLSGVTVTTTEAFKGIVLGVCSVTPVKI